jgi:hypothetical protein
LAASGCIALSAGLEAASDRLLVAMKKGITVDQTVRVVDACHRAGILVHAYLMYGLPGETVTETVESLERVRQLFGYDLIQSAFWHRFTTTAHSPIGLNPEAHGIRITGPAFGGFAENDVAHEDAMGPTPEWLGEGLRAALAHYKEGEGLDLDVRSWFPVSLSRPKVRRDWVKRVLASDPPVDHSFLEHRLVWIGGTPVKEHRKGDRCRVILSNRTMDGDVTLPTAQADWLLNLVCCATPVPQSGGHRYPVLREVRADFPFGKTKGFDAFWKSKIMEIARTIGLLVV